MAKPQTKKRRAERRKARDLAVTSGRARTTKGGHYPNFLGGVRVATGDVDSGGKAAPVLRS